MTMFGSPAHLLPPFSVITPYSEEALGYTQHGLDGIGQCASSSWGISDRVCYWPFRLDVPRTAVKMFVVNGATDAAANWDIGIYDAEGHQLVSSGATATTGTNAIQEFDITDTLLAPGDYFIGLYCSLNTQTIFTNAATDESSISQIVAFGDISGTGALPATATFAKTTEANWRFCVCGVSFDTVI